MQIRFVSALVAMSLLAGCSKQLGFDIATGYAAKQVCSGVFVAGLPEDHLLEYDVMMTVAALGPLRPLLKVDVDREQRMVRAGLLGATAKAFFTGSTGCVLHGEGFHAPDAQPIAAVDSTVAKPPAPASVMPALEPALDAAFAEPEEGQRKTLAILVSHRGKLIAERYARPASAHTPMQSWSMNKSLMSTWIGMQAERGLLDTKAPLAPQLTSSNASLAAQLDPALNLEHLLHMESGLDFLEQYGPGSDVTRMLYSEPGAWRVAAAKGHTHAPGEFFYYSSGDTNLASWFWQQSLSEPYIEWVQREFAEPLALGAVVAEHDATGTQVGSSYTFMTARDWLRVGEFWLSAYQGQSPLLSAEWMQVAVAPRAAATDGNYGRGFWLNTKGVDFPALPKDLFYAAGHNGQYVMVFPRHALVIVRLGLTYGEGPINGVEALAAAVLEVISEDQTAGR